MHSRAVFHDGRNNTSFYFIANEDASGHAMVLYHDRPRRLFRINPHVAGVPDLQQTVPAELYGVLKLYADGGVSLKTLLCHLAVQRHMAHVWFYARDVHGPLGWAFFDTGGPFIDPAYPTPMRRAWSRVAPLCARGVTDDLWCYMFRRGPW